MKTYKIEPLKWDKKKYPGRIEYTAKTSIGTYRIDKYINCRPAEYWYGYVEKGIEYEHQCGSIEHSKKLCQKRYEKKLENV